MQNVPPTVPAIKPVPLANQITIGLQPQARVQAAVERWHVGLFLNQHSALQSAVQFSFGEAGYSGSSASNSKGKKRAQPEDRDQPTSTVHKRRARTCPRCHRMDCEGRFKSRACS